MSSASLSSDSFLMELRLLCLLSAGEPVREFPREAEVDDGVVARGLGSEICLVTGPDLPFDLSELCKK